MCQDIKKIKNKYTGKELYVACGKCPACQQEKAARRATRIRNNSAFGTLCLFITLTYDRLSCPVVFREDIESRKGNLNIYRLVQVRNVRVGRHYEMGTKRQYKLTKIGEFNDCCYPSEITVIPKLKRLNSKYVGVCYYKDVQDFFKRLRAYVNYHLPDGKNTKYSYFVTSEYGETTFRPHHHALLFVPSHLTNEFRKAVAACWSFGDRKRTRIYCQIARDAASYVASYVNCDTDFPDLYKTKTFRPHHAFSKHFGVGLDCFQLDKVLQKADKSDLSYNSVSHRGGVVQIRTCAIPSYVLHRFFPLYKGYTKRSDADNRNVISRGFTYQDCPPRDVYERLQVNLGLRDPLKIGGSTAYNHKYNVNTSFSPDEVHKYNTRLRHAYDYYHEVTGKNRYDYAIDHVRVWNAYKSTCLRLFYDSAAEFNYQDAYDNIGDYLTGKVRSLNLDKYGLPISRTHAIFEGSITSLPVLDPNRFPLNIAKHNRLIDTYEKKRKTRKVANTVLSANGHWV